MALTGKEKESHVCTYLIVTQSRPIIYIWEVTCLHREEEKKLPTSSATMCVCEHFTWKQTNIYFIFASDINLPYRHCCETLNTVIQLTVLCISTHTMCSHCNNGYANTSQCYVIWTLPILFQHYHEVCILCSRRQQWHCIQLLKLIYYI
jgi:hypothetical protein